MGDTLDAVAALLPARIEAAGALSVADALLGDDAAQASTAAVGRLAAALGTLHLSTRARERHLDGLLCQPPSADTGDRSNRALGLLSCQLCWARAEQVDLDARSLGPGHRAGMDKTLPHVTTERGAARL